MDTTQAADTTGIWITKAMDLGVEYGLNILWVVLIFMIGKFVAGRLAKATIRALERANVDKVLSGFAGNMVRYAVITFTLIACLGVFGVETTSFVAVLAAAGFAIGLAFQGTLSNFSSGVMLLFFRPFNVGDVIDAGGVVGAVQELQLFTTRRILPAPQISEPCVDVFEGANTSVDGCLTLGGGRGSHASVIFCSFVIWYLINVPS